MLGLAERYSGHKTMRLGPRKHHNPPLFQRKEKPCVIPRVRAESARVSVSLGRDTASWGSVIICTWTVSDQVLWTLMIYFLAFEHSESGILLCISSSCHKP